MKVEIGKRLKRLRLEKGLTQKELAAAVRGGLDYTYIGKIERGEQLPSLKILIKISEALSVPVNYFFLDEASPAMYGIPAIDLQLSARNKKGRELFKALKLLYEEDVPLVTEIVLVLNRHRKVAKRKLPDLPEDEGALLAAEEGPSYEK